MAGKQPPPRPEGAPAGDGSGTILAVDSLYLGENGSDWKTIGYDLDGRVSDGSDPTLCKPYGGVNPKSVHQDGNEGIDNAFGGNLLGIITTLVMSPSSEVNAQIAEGSFTIIMDMDKLGTGPNYVDIHTYLNIGSDLGGPPSFDGSDEWPIVYELLTDPTNPRSTKLQFPGAYVADNVWVSGDKGNIDLSLSIGGFSLNLGITNAVMTAELSADRKSADNGVIAGVIPVEPFLAELSKIAGAVDDSFCEGSTIENIKDQIRQAADMPATGDHDPNKACDAISVGIGFTAKAVQIGETSEPAGEIGDPCDPTNEGGGGAGAAGAAGGAGGEGGEGGEGGGGGA